MFLLLLLSVGKISSKYVKFPFENSFKIALTWILFANSNTKYPSFFSSLLTFLMAQFGSLMWCITLIMTATSYFEFSFLFKFSTFERIYRTLNSAPVSFFEILRIFFGNF